MGRKFLGQEVPHPGGGVPTEQGKGHLKNTFAVREVAYVPLGWHSITFTYH